jgi:general nucleoside transport system permease protein
MRVAIIDSNRRSVIIQEVLRYCLAFGLAIAVGILIVLARHENPVEVYRMLVWGSVGTPMNFIQTIRWSTPLIMSGLANLIAFRAGIWNLDVETQLQFGALFAAVIGNIQGLPPLVHIPLTLLVGALAGGIWAFIPAILYVRFRMNELVTTLMMGYIGSLLIEYLLRYHFHAPFAPGASPNNIATADIAQSARLPQLMPPSEASVGIFIAIALCFVLFILYRKTVLGYEADVLGLNRRFARYGGIESRRVLLFLFLLSGAVAGLAGALEVMGSQYSYSSLFPKGLGFDGIVVGILSQNSPLPTIPAGLFFGILRSGGYVVEQTTKVNRAAISVIQGLILLFFTIQIVWPAIRTKFSRKEKAVQSKEKKGNA